MTERPVAASSTARVARTAAAISKEEQDSMQHSRSAVLALTALSALGAARAQSVELVSRSALGVLGNGDCALEMALSGDGRFVAFGSAASNLIPGVTGTGHAYLVDRATHAIEHLTMASGGGFGLSAPAAVGGVSDDGRFVAFRADGLLDLDYGVDIYVRDRVAGTTVELTPFEFQGLQRSVPQLSADGQRVMWWERNNWFPPSDSTHIWVKTRTGGAVASVAGSASGTAFDTWVDSPRMSSDGANLVFGRSSSQGRELVHWAFGAPTSPQTQIAFDPAGSSLLLECAALSHDGRFVAFIRQLNSGSFEAWLRDMATGSVERIDAPYSGALWSASLVGGISQDGRYIAFVSWATNVVPGDTNGFADAFVRDRVLNQTARISVSATGGQANFASERVVLARSGAGVALLSSATNLVAGDTNGARDVFYRSMCGEVFADADGDGFGAGPASFTCALPQAGQASNDDDCDDNNGAVNPARAEVCNGIDDDCDGQVDDDIGGVAYCVSTPSTNGCTATLGSSGCPSASASSGFSVRVSGLDGQRNVMLFYGASAVSVPFSPPNTMCVGAPRQRTSVMHASGASGACDGSAALDVAAWTTANPGALLLPWNAGQVVNFQAWFRDHASSAGFRLTNGWQVTLTQ